MRKFINCLALHTSKKNLIYVLLLLYMVKPRWIMYLYLQYRCLDAAEEICLFSCIMSKLLFFYFSIVL